jgi:hypothetical protein
MDSVQMRMLTSKLTRAAATGNWARVVELDLRVASVLRSAPVRRTPEEAAALASLRAAHTAALELCRKEAARFRAVLRDLTDRREGLLAYSLEAERGAT